MICNHSRAKLTGATPNPGAVVMRCPDCKMELTIGMAVLGEVYRQKMIAKSKRSDRDVVR